MAPAVSICIPCFRSERFIRTTIESALAQTVPPSEILVSDDHSPDRTYEIAAEYTRIASVRVIRPPRRMTIGEHYRYLLQNASGEFICFLSHDDALMPGFVETMGAKVEGGVALIAAACLRCDSRLKPFQVIGMNLPRRTLPVPEGYLHFRRGCVYTMSASIMCRRMLLEIPPLPPAADLATDWYWAMMLGLKGDVKFERKPMGYYRVHDANAGHANPNGWNRACASMLNFLSSQVGPEFKQDVLEKLQRVGKEIAATEVRPEPVASAQPLIRSLKSLLKNAVAIRYRRLPPHISRAERGVGTAVENAPKR